MITIYFQVEYKFGAISIISLPTLEPQKLSLVVFPLNLVLDPCTQVYGSIQLIFMQGSN